MSSSPVDDHTSSPNTTVPNAMEDARPTPSSPRALSPPTPSSPTELRPEEHQPDLARLLAMSLGLVPPVVGSTVDEQRGLGANSLAECERRQEAFYEQMQQQEALQHCFEAALSAHRAHQREHLPELMQRAAAAAAAADASTTTAAAAAVHAHLRAPLELDGVFRTAFQDGPAGTAPTHLLTQLLRGDFSPNVGGGSTPGLEEELATQELLWQQHCTSTASSSTAPRRGPAEDEGADARPPGGADGGGAVPQSVEILDFRSSAATLAPSTTSDAEECSLCLEEVGATFRILVGGDDGPAGSGCRVGAAAGPGSTLCGICMLLSGRRGGGRNFGMQGFVTGVWGSQQSSSVGECRERR